MSFPTCAYGREQLDSADWSVVASTGGSLSGGTYYFSLQGRNRSGLNIASYSNAIVIPSNGRVTITLNQTANKTGEDWLYYIVSASTSNISNTFAQVAAIPQGETSLVLSKPEHLLLAGVVASPTALPSGVDLVNGMLRSVTSANAIYSYNKLDSISIVDNINILQANPGRWKRTGGFYTQVSDIKSPIGCGQDLRTVTSLEYVNYIPADSTSEEAKLWLINDSANGIASGTGVSLSLSIGGQDVTTLFSNKLILKFLGYVNLATGILDIYQEDGVNQLLGINTEFNYVSGKTSFTLPKSLPTNYAFAFSVKVKFTTAEVNQAIANGSTLSIVPGFSSSDNNQVDGIDLLGDCVYVTSELYTHTLRRVVPSTGLTATALPGKGLISPYQFSKDTSQLISGFAPNTANQKVAIVGSTGNCFVTNSVPTASALRAVVGTVAGESAASDYSLPMILANSTSGISVVVNYPCNGQGKGTIRSSYEDVVRGNNQGDFNPKYINLYISNGTIVKKFSNNLVVAQATQTFAVSNWDAGTTVTTLPNTEFGLYTASDINTPTSTGVGNIPSGTYRVAYSFVYDGNQITSINHKATNCIAEVSVVISEVYDRSVYWGVPSTLETIRNMTVAQLVNGLELKLLKSNGTTVTAKYDTTSLVADDNGVTSIRPNAIGINQSGRFITAGDADNSTARWNANKLQGISISSNFPTDLQALLYDANTETWIPSDVALDAGTTFNYRGTYDNAETYNSRDLVNYQGSSYFSISTTTITGVLPTVTTSWQLLAAKGEDGIISNYTARGDYNNDTTYQEWDLIFYPTTGNSYVYINTTSSAGNLPTDATYWQASASGTGGVSTFNGRAGIITFENSDIPADSITDVKIGSRTADMSYAPSGLTNTLTNWLSGIVNRIKAITGTSNWYDAPPITLTGTKTHIDNTANPHGVTATQVGNTTAQWNANKIQGWSVSNTAPTNGQALVWDTSSSQIKFGNVSTTGGSSGSGTSPWILVPNNYVAVKGDRLLVDVTTEDRTIKLPIGTIGAEVNIFSFGSNIVNIDFTDKYQGIPYNGLDSGNGKYLVGLQLESVNPYASLIYTGEAYGWISKTIVKVYEDTPVEIEGDPYFNNVVLLSDFESSNDSTTFTDAKDNIFTFHGTASISSTQARFGNTSLSVSSSGFVSLPGGSNFDFPSDFTIEFSVYMTSLPNFADFATFIDVGGYTNGFRIGYFNYSQKVLEFILRETNTYTWIPWEPTANTWYDFIVTRINGVVKIGLNGTQFGADINNSGIVDSSLGLKFGRSSNNSYALNGFIDNVRFTKGVGRAIVPLTASFPTNNPGGSIASLLMHFDGLDGSTNFVDEAGQTISRTGNVRISTTQSKFGGSSLYLPGDGILQITSGGAGSSLDLAGGDFTIDFWYYHINRSFYSAILGWDGTDHPLMIYNGSGVGNVKFACGTSSSWFLDGLDMGEPLVNTWVHYAITRQGNIFRSFKNGVLTSSIEAPGTIAAPSTITIGGNSGYFVTAYIDELRITRTCEFIASFTPSEAPYSNSTGLTYGV